MVHVYCSVMRQHLNMRLFIVPILATTFLSVGVKQAESQKLAPCAKVGTVKKIGGTNFKCTRQNKSLVYIKIGQSSKSETDLSTDPSITNIASLDQVSTCKIADATVPESYFSSGFPRAGQVANFKSTYRVLVIPISFTDLQFTSSSQSGIKTAYETANKLLTAMSYGQSSLQVTFASTQNWQSFPGPVSNYIESAGAQSTTGNKFDNSALVRTVIANYSLIASLSGFDAVDVSTANDMTYKILSEFAMPSGSGGQYSTNNVVSAVAHFGMIGRAWNVSHELGHALFGFEDLYAPTKAESYLNGWDLMETSTGTSELMGWHRWLAGWISDSQVRCVATSGNSNHFLSALNIKDTKPKFVVVKNTATSAYVIELRNRTDFDLVQQTLIVYSINTAFPTGAGPVRLVGEIRKAGDKVSLPGINITLTSITSAGAIVGLQKN
jgi:M6 family metalloprotease-like protein